MITAITLLNDAQKSLSAMKSGKPTIELAQSLVCAAQLALQEVTTVSDAKNIRDKLGSIETYFKKQHADLISSNTLVIQRLRTERTLGRMIPRQFEDGRPTKKPLHGERVILQDIGITYAQSSRWQQEAMLDDADFDLWAHDNIETLEFSSAALLRFCKEFSPNGHNIELPDSENEGAKVEHGDVWKLGKHTLYCGDTSDNEFQSMLSRSALVFADPPYGAGVKGFEDSCFYWEHDYLIDYANIVTVTPGIVSIFEFARKTSMPYKWSLATWITNGMTRGALGFGNWIYTAVFSNESIYRNAQDFSRVSIRTAETDETEHKGRKPAEYMLWIIELFSRSGNTVIDPFLGSGQTLLTCEKLGRTCIGGEIKKEFCSDIIGRWENMTGKKAVKE